MTMKRVISVGQLLTAEQFWTLPEVPEKSVELVRGEVVLVPTPSNPHNLIAATVYRLLYTFTFERDLGVVFADNTGYLLRRAPDTVRVPDVSFVSWERIPGGVVPQRWTIAPDLAVEIVSPDDREKDVREKIGEYLAAGTQSVWVLQPAERSLRVYTADGDRELGVDETLNGGEMLPGFSVPVAALFAVRRTRAE